MANVSEYLQDILDAVYGEEVRGSIHDAIVAMNEESTNAEAVAISSQQSAKRSAERAATSETNAENRAASALASKNAAKTSETNAKSSAREAAASETNAANSETAAKSSETYAKLYETNAKNSETAAKSSETNAKASETASKTSETNAKASELLAYQYEQQCEQIRDDIGYPIDPKGTVTFANLPSVSSAQIGWMYNVSDDFTTTSDFEEDAGKFYSAGSEVYLNSNNKWSVMAGPGVTGIKGEAETTYHKGQVNITKSMLGIDTLDDISTPTFTQASTRANINSGETISTIMGKIKKFFADLKTVAFTGNASDVTFDNTGTSSSAITVQAGLVEALSATVPTASDVPYDNTTSSVAATNVQSAIDKSFMDVTNQASEPADMNNVTTMGTHTINPSVTTLNVPIASQWGMVEVFSHSTGIVQVWTSTDNTKHYIRTKSGSPLTWSSWVQIPHSSDLAYMAKTNANNNYTASQYIGTSASRNMTARWVDAQPRQVWQGFANSTGSFYCYDSTRNAAIWDSTAAGVNTFRGNITGYSPNFCVYSTAGETTKTLANETWTNLLSIPVVAGGWYLINAHVQFAANKNGARALNIRPTATDSGLDAKVQPSQSGVTEMSYFSYHSGSASRLYLNAFQNSGAALAVSSATLSVLRLK